jgi:hypothetical protein
MGTTFVADDRDHGRDRIEGASQACECIQHRGDSIAFVS